MATMTKDMRVRLTVWPVVAMSLSGAAWAFKSCWVFFDQFAGRMEGAGQTQAAFWVKVGMVVALCMFANYALVATANVASMAAGVIRRGE